MTFEQNAALPKRFVTSVLPWLIGLAGGAIYFATMSHWATFSSVGIVARASGWVWQPELLQPLSYLAYYPFRFLPEHSIPMALNSFNAVLAGLTLTLLARAIALMPHDRTSDQRDLVNNEYSLFSARSAWIPPVLAAVVLGLQISFWENATSVSSEIIDVFLVAYVVRCLLEFRIDDRASWLYRVAFIYAAGITNNWALIGLAPCLLMAIIWLKGISFFNGRFIMTMFLLGLAGLSLYLLLPLVYSLSTVQHVGFKDGFLANFLAQKRMVASIYYFYRDNYRFVPLAATSLLPLFFIGLRWRASFGDTSPIGIFITKAVFHLLHAGFMFVCLLVVLCPGFSPRQMVPGLPFLNHTYFCALVVGYCAGYFLLISGPALRSRKRMPPPLRLAGYCGWGGVVLALIIMPIALVGRNLTPVRIANGKLMDRFMAHWLEPVASQKASIISDDPTHLAIARAYLVQRGEAKNYVYHDTQSAKYSDYHASQLRIQGERWPTNFATLTNHVEITPIGLTAFIGELAKAGPLYYLEPSFGFYFEKYELKPEGMAYAMSIYPTNVLIQPPPSEDVIESNQKWWAQFDEELLPALQRWIPSEDMPKPHPAWQKFLYAKLHLKDETVPTAELLGSIASRAANNWAVELQKAGLWTEAAAGFNRALALNPKNASARINLTYNETREQGKPVNLAATSRVEDEFGKYQDWNQVMAVCGPFDEPRFTFEQGRTFLSGRLYRQAITSIKRVVELSPTNYTAIVWLADLYTALGQPDESLALVTHVRSNPEAFELDPTKGLNLDRIEATALFRQDKKPEAQAVLENALSQPDVGTSFRAVAAQLFLQAGMSSNALPLLERAVNDTPTDVRLRANLGYACLQLEKYDRAREVFTSALELDPTNSVIRLNRAITLLRAKDYPAAKEDYLTLQKEYPKAYQIQFGLGEIALAENDRSNAISHFEECMKLTPPNTPDYVQVSNRLAALRSENK